MANPAQGSAALQLRSPKNPGRKSVPAKGNFCAIQLTLAVAIAAVKQTIRNGYFNQSAINRLDRAQAQTPGEAPGAMLASLNSRAKAVVC
jgi:hypothetical protein